MSLLHATASPTRLLLLLAASLACDDAAALQPRAAVDDASRLASAELLLNGGDCRAGAEAYARAAAGSRDSRIARRATDVGLACAHLPAAWQSAQRWAAVDPENVDALRAAGLVALELWRIDDARRLFAELLAKPDVESDRALGDLLPLVAEGEHAPAAWLAFDQVVDRASASAATLVALARLAAAADDLGAAARLLDAARARGGAETPAMARLAAAIAVAEGDDVRALEAARTAARQDPAEQSFAVAETLVDLDRNEEAFREVERISQLPELRAEADRRLALLALASGDLVDAQRRFGGRLQRSTGTAEAVFYLGLIAERRGDLDLALQSYRRLVEAGAGLLPRTRAAALLIRRGEPDAGVALLDEHARANRDDLIEVESTKAQLFADAGQHDAALAALDAALTRHPSHPSLLYQRAMVLETGGRTREAVRAFERLLRERPADASLLNALGYTLADRGRQLKRAERLVREALQQRPDNAAFIDSLGWVRFRRGDAAGALPLLERAWRLSRDPEIAAHWGEVLWALGDTAQARVVWARALSRAPDSRPLRAVLERYTGADPAGAAPP